MRKLLLTAPLLAALLIGCQSKTPVGPGTVKITETTTSTTTTTTTTSTIFVATKAEFSFSPITPEILQTVTFSGLDSVPAVGRTIVRYDWDFGDGVNKSGIRVTHDYFPVGVYLVTLTVTDSAGDKGMVAKTITVRPIVP